MGRGFLLFRSIHIAFLLVRCLRNTSATLPSKAFRSPFFVSWPGSNECHTSGGMDGLQGVGSRGLPHRTQAAMQTGQATAGMLFVASSAAESLQ